MSEFPRCPVRLDLDLSDYLYFDRLNQITRVLLYFNIVWKFPVVNGYLEVGWNLDNNPTIIRYNSFRIDDNKVHLAVFRRENEIGSLSIDHGEPEVGDAVGPSNILNCNGNIYLGKL